MSVRRLPGGPFHLVRRFFEVLRTRPLDPAEQMQVAGWLELPLSDLFFEQPAADQRHAFEVARRYRAIHPDDRDGIAAALLHDVGKRHARLGAVGRSLATMAGALGLPMPGRWRLYLDHGSRSADELERLGAPRIAVAFARHHPGTPPADVDGARWHSLAAADDA